MKKFLKYHADRKEFEVIKKEETEDMLKFLYRQIECDIIEIARLSDDIEVVVDEEGLFKGDNAMTQLIFEGRKTQPFSGNLVFVSPDYETGEIISLTDEMIEHIQQQLFIPVGVASDYGLA